MTRSTLAYWTTTGLTAAAFAAAGLGGLVDPEPTVAILAHLGYPAYVVTILSTWKLLAAIALVAPGLPRLKEWAHAGITFVLTGAAASHLAAGDPAGSVVPPLGLLALATASWALRPASRRLGGATVAAAAAPAARPAAPALRAA